MEYDKKLANLEDLRVLCENRSRAEDAILYEAVAFATKYTDSNLGFISVVDFENERFLHSKKRYVVSVDPSGWRQDQRFALRIGGKILPRNERSISGFVASTRKLYCCKDVRSDEYYLSLNSEVRSEVCAPIEHDGTLLGVINLESYSLDHYTENHEYFLCYVARCIAEPLARFRQGEREKYIEGLATKDFLTLYQQRHSTSQDFLRAALQQITKRIKALRATARIKDKNRLALRAACYPDTMQFPNGLKPADLFLPIGADNLPPHERSLVGYVGHTKQMKRLPHVRQFNHFYDLDGQGRSALCTPILFDGNLLGTILLLHDQEDFYTKYDARYLSTFTQYIAMPLYGLLERDNYRTPPEIIRTVIQNTMADLKVDDPFATLESSNAIAKHIAISLRSNLCTIWLVDASGELAWHGAFGVPSASSHLKQSTQAHKLGKKVSQAIRDVFGMQPMWFRPGLKACHATVGWRALSKPEIQNHGPNRDPAFLQQDYVQPFMVVPLLSYNNRAIGVIHVGLKNTTSYNQHGFYVGVDEQLLVSFQREIIAFYEQWRFRATTEFAVQDLHDALSLVTYDLLYGLDHAQQELELEDTLSAAARLQDIEYTAQSLVREIRGIMVGLKSHVLENMGLVKALKHFIDTSVRRPGLMVDFISEEPSTWLSNKSAWQIYRIAQEALTNVIKHAAADHIMCRVDITETEITLYISDNGRGFDVLSREIVRHGLTNMRKRAEKALGGEFDVQSKPGEGTTVTVKVPRGGWYATTID